MMPFPSRPLFALVLAGLTAPLAARADDPADAPSCFEVEGEGVVVGKLDCLNAMLSKRADAAHRQAQSDPGSSAWQLAHQSPVSQGLYSEAGTRERLGSAFGHSAIPQRPQTRVPGLLGAAPPR